MRKEVHIDTGDGLGVLCGLHHHSERLYTSCILIYKDHGWEWNIEPTCDACILMYMSIQEEDLHCKCNACVKQSFYNE